MIERALEFAQKAHEGQVRKGTRRPYIVHPIDVAKIVSMITDDEEIISAALLHDTIEDCDEVTQEVLKDLFGVRVSKIVAAESEDKTKTWMERKSATIEHVKTAQYEVKLVCFADKLSNLRDIDRDYQELGEKLWERFRMKDKKIIGWYYKGIRESLKETFSELELFQEYCNLIEKIFG